MKSKAYRATSVKDVKISEIISRLAEGPVWAGLDVGKGQAEKAAVALGRGEVPSLFGQCGDNDPVAQLFAVDQHTVAVEDNEAKLHSACRPVQAAENRRRTPDHATSCPMQQGNRHIRA